MNGAIIPLRDVQARWGYSEIADSNFTQLYDNMPNVDALPAKRKEGIAFDDLSAAERYGLALQCATIRANLMTFMVSIVGFHEVSLARAAIGSRIVPPHVWHPESQGNFVPFSHFITTHAQSPNDSRNVTGDTATYQFPSAPLTIGRLYQHPVLLDGYHRAAAFWKYGPATGTLRAYVPGLVPSRESVAGTHVPNRRLFAIR